MRNLFLAAVATIAISTPALAESGPIVEGQIGYDSPSYSGTLGSSSGVTYGVTLGYELEIDDAVFLGAEVSLDDSTAKDCLGSRTVVDPMVCASAGRDFGAGVRVGYDVGAKTSLYLVAGYTNAKVSIVADDGTGPIGGSANLDGLKVGIGLRQYFTQKAYGKVEYRYSNYEGGFQRHQGLVGVGYQF